jgi:hypothetical protein
VQPLIYGETLGLEGQLKYFPENIFLNIGWRLIMPLFFPFVLEKKSSRECV